MTTILENASGVRITEEDMNFNEIAEFVEVAEKVEV